MEENIQNYSPSGMFRGTPCIYTIIFLIHSAINKIEKFDKILLTSTSTFLIIILLQPHVLNLKFLTTGYPILNLTVRAYSKFGFQR